MSYTNESGRLQILGDIEDGAEHLAAALASLGEAFDHLDEQGADKMEAELFRPVQSAYARLRRTHSEFAARHGLPETHFRQANQPLPSDPRAAIERAVESVRLADESLAELQDSMLPVEVGDQPLRAGLSEVRTLIGPVPVRSGALLRTLGR